MPETRVAQRPLLLRIAPSDEAAEPGSPLPRAGGDQEWAVPGPLRPR